VQNQMIAADTAASTEGAPSETCELFREQAGVKRRPRLQRPDTAWRLQLVTDHGPLITIPTAEAAGLDEVSLSG